MLGGPPLGPRARARMEAVKDLRISTAVDLLGCAWHDVGPDELRERIWAAREILRGAPSVETVQKIAKRPDRSLDGVTPFLDAGNDRPWMRGVNTGHGVEDLAANRRAQDEADASV